MIQFEGKQRVVLFLLILLSMSAASYTTTSQANDSEKVNVLQKRRPKTNRNQQLLVEGNDGVVSEAMRIQQPKRNSNVHRSTRRSKGIRRTTKEVHHLNASVHIKRQKRRQLRRSKKKKKKRRKSDAPSSMPSLEPTTILSNQYHANHGKPLLTISLLPFRIALQQQPQYNVSSVLQQALIHYLSTSLMIIANETGTISLLENDEQGTSNSDSAHYYNYNGTISLYETNFIVSSTSLMASSPEAETKQTTKAADNEIENNATASLMQLLLMKQTMALQDIISLNDVLNRTIVSSKSSNDVQIVQIDIYTPANGDNHTNYDDSGATTTITAINNTIPNNNDHDPYSSNQLHTAVTDSEQRDDPSFFAKLFGSSPQHTMIFSIGILLLILMILLCITCIASLYICYRRRRYDPKNIGIMKDAIMNVNTYDDDDSVSKEDDNGNNVHNEDDMNEFNHVTTTPNNEFNGLEGYDGPGGRFITVRHRFNNDDDDNQSYNSSIQSSITTATTVANGPMDPVMTMCDANNGASSKKNNKDTRNILSLPSHTDTNNDDEDDCVDSDDNNYIFKSATSTMEKSSCITDHLLESPTIPAIHPENDTARNDKRTSSMNQIDHSNDCHHDTDHSTANNDPTNDDDDVDWDKLSNQNDGCSIISYMT